MASVKCINSILSLKETPFGRGTMKKIVNNTIPTSQTKITIKQVATKKGKPYTRGFSKNWYQKKSWLAGCEVASAVFCYPCLLFHPEGSIIDSTAWTTTGAKDMHHLSEKVKKHQQAKLHLDSCLKFCGFGRVNIARHVDEGYRIAVFHHNDEVNKNRHILNRLIQCVKFCGVFDLALRGKDVLWKKRHTSVIMKMEKWLQIIFQSGETWDE